jgi:hypothetical protein
VRGNTTPKTISMVLLSQTRCNASGAHRRTAIQPVTKATSNRVPTKSLSSGTGAEQSGAVLLSQRGATSRAGQWCEQNVRWTCLRASAPSANASRALCTSETSLSAGTASFVSNGGALGVSMASKASCEGQECLAWHPSCSPSGTTILSIDCMHTGVSPR